jgi:glycerol-3-phosphate dehydrogenase
MSRQDLISKAGSEIFDIAVIGGGITGAGIFELAGKQGYKCILVDKGDFASGTSSRSAKLIHGGLRYLQYGHFKLVREGLKERRKLIDQYPELVKPLAFVFPLYHERLKYIIGMHLYQWLAWDNKMPAFRYMPPFRLRKKFPCINDTALKGGLIYYDAVTNDAKLCNEVIHRSMESTENIAINYLEVISGKESDDVYEISCKDNIDNNIHKVKCSYVINASGVWTDNTLKKIANNNEITSSPSKGVHIVIPKERFPLDKAVLFPSFKNDGRTIYAVPWENESIIVGTTDTECKEIDNPFAEKEDIKYILDALNAFIPTFHFTEKDILSTYAGIRPLLKEDKDSKERTREYKIWWTGNRIINILGGKLTSFQSMAEHLMNTFSETAKDKIIPEKKGHIPFKDKKSELIRSIEKENVSSSGKINKDIDHTESEIIYYIRHRSCHSPDDLLARRLSLKYVINRYPDKREIVCRILKVMQKEKGWSEDFTLEQIEKFITDTENFIPN